MYSVVATISIENFICANTREEAESIAEKDLLKLLSENTIKISDKRNVEEIKKLRKLRNNKFKISVVSQNASEE